MSEIEGTCQPNNVLLFRLALSNCFKNIAESVSEDEFIRILTILKPNPSTGQKLHKAMIKELYNGMNKELEDMLEEGSLQNGLLKISKLSEDASASTVRKNVWRPPGNVPLHLRSLDAEKVKEATEDLENNIIHIENENEHIMKEIKEKRVNAFAVDELMTRTLKHTPIVLKRLDKVYKQYDNCIAALEDDY